MRESATWQPTRSESYVAALLLCLTAYLKVFYVLRLRVNSDEGQHLHVAWAWTQGLVQYRDVSDNHMPLFHLLLAPVVAAYGERPDIAVAARVVLIPLYVLTLWATHEIARPLFGPRAALWSVIATALLPAFFLTISEARADALSTCLAVCGLAVAYASHARKGRSFIAGLLFGASAIASVKSIVFLGTLFAGSALARFGEDGRIALFPARVHGVAAATGLLVFPSLLVVLLAWLGALGWFFMEVLHRDLVGALAVEKRRFELILLLPLAIPVTWFGVRSILARVSDPLRRNWIAGLFATTLLAFVAIVVLSPRLRPQDWLGLYPLLVVLIVGSLWISSSPAVDRLRSLVHPACGLTLVAGIEIVLLFVSVSPWRRPDVSHASRIRDVLRLTDPGDRVMDLKGETVFRKRAVRPALEQITRAQIAAGTLADDIPEHLTAGEIAVAVHDSGNFPVRTRSFLARNYVNVGHVRVLGKLLPDPDANDEDVRFDIEVPGRYTVVSREGPLPETLVDGAEIGAGRRLEAGPHRLDTIRNTRPLAVVWAQAVERGFSPFRLESSPNTAHDRP